MVTANSDILVPPPNISFSLMWVDFVPKTIIKDAKRWQADHTASARSLGARSLLRALCDRTNAGAQQLDCKRWRSRAVCDICSNGATGRSSNVNDDSCIILYHLMGVISKTSFLYAVKSIFTSLLYIQVIMPVEKGRRFRFKGRITSAEFNKMLRRTCGFMLYRTRRQDIAR